MATILIIEDDVLLAECFMRWLQSASYKIQHAFDGYTAIDVMDTTIPDVILLDILLPGANGIQFLHTLRSHRDLAHVPVILCSSALPPDSPGLAYGVVGMLNKSELTRPALQRAVREALHAAAV
jgi:CheY-like chemotaxis protein